MSSRYKISNEFFPFNYFSTPTNPLMIRFSSGLLKIWGFIKFNVERDPRVTVEKLRVPGYKGKKITIYLISPRGCREPLPCLVDAHGGGFMFEASPSQIDLAMQYAKYGKFKVAFVNYHLHTDIPQPAPQEDFFAAYRCIVNHADELGIDRYRIGVAGDSAGGMLAATTCMLARDRGIRPLPRFQVLLYPWLDDRFISESCRKYTDTPMWNSTLAKKLVPIMNADPENIPAFLRSPVQAESFADLPPAYIEVAEYDCLHDDGILFAKKLREAGVNVHLDEVRGAMHGFDTKLSAPTTRRMVLNRVQFMKKMFR
ncbi:MAG: alpha/beta hydrolase [Eubacterium sp.]|nr:alpha/beta hydrolase [Eubacterium sp.]